MNKKQYFLPAFFSLLCLTVLNSYVVAADNCDEARKWYNEGMTLNDNSDREAAYHQRAIEMCPTFSEAYNRLGEILKSRGDYDAAITQLNKAKLNAYLSGDESLLIKPGLNLGEIYRRQGDYEMAVEEFVRVLEVDPESRVANNQLEYLYKRTGRYDASTELPREMLTNATFTRISGMTLPKGAALTDFQYQYWVQKSSLTADMFAEDVPLVGAPVNREAHVNLFVFGLRYGVSNSLTLGLLPKVFSRKSVISLDTLGMEASPQATGLGDTVLMLKYLFWGERTSYFSGFSLLSVPTGDEDLVVEDNGLQRRIPLGSGSYDVTLGLAYTSRFDPVTVHGNISYMFTDGEVVGDEFRADLAASYPLTDYVDSVLELNYRWRDSATARQWIETFVGRPEVIGPSFATLEGGMVSFETDMIEEGGSTLFISPSLQFFLGNGIKAELGVQVPIIEPGDAWVEEAVYHFGLTYFYN